MDDTTPQPNASGVAVDVTSSSSPVQTTEVTRTPHTKLIIGSVALVIVIIGVLIVWSLYSTKPESTSETTPSESPALTSTTDAKTGESVYSEKQLTSMLQGTDADKKKAVEYITMKDPASVSPFVYAQVVQDQWDMGNKLQASFWFYVLQSRTRAWSKSDSQGDGYAALRASYMDVLGSEINGWVGSDIDAWKTVASRAISYEKKMPLYAGRPDGINQADWNALVERERQAYADEFVTYFPKQTEYANLLKGRKDNGLHVGPLQNPGEPLPESWK